MVDEKAIETVEVSAVIKIAHDAGEFINSIYNSPESLDIAFKEDNSPITIADIGASKMIVKGLSSLYPLIPVISEEACDIDIKTRQSFKRYWLVDPLDGTKEFIERTNDFTINIALMENNEPTLGVIYAPVSKEIYYARKGQRAYKQMGLFGTPIPIQTQSAALPYKLMVSRRHGLLRLKAFLVDKKGSFTWVDRGSSLKTCIVAEGLADCYPRFGPTSEWDTAAAHCILRCAGGDICNLDGKPLTYNDKQDFINPDFVAVGDMSIDWVAWLGINI